MRRPPRPPRPLRTRRLLAAAMLVPLLAGCGGAPQASDPPSASPNPSASPSPTPPALPDAATRNSRQGAGAFVEHYVDVLNYATASGDLAEARALSDTSCESCTAMLDAIQAVYDDGGSVEGGAWNPQLRSAVRGGPNTWVVDAAIRFSPQRVTASENATPEAYPGGRDTASFRVEFRNNAWTVVETTRA